MQLLSQTQLNEDVLNIKILHAKLGNDIAKSFAFHSGNLQYLEHLNQQNFMIGVYVDILEDYSIRGDASVANYYNVLTLSNIESIIDDCYRVLEKYNTLPLVTRTTAAAPTTVTAGISTVNMTDKEGAIVTDKQGTNIEIKAP